MPVTNQGPDEWFARVTKYILGQGGIVWEAVQKVLRSRADGINWTVADDIPSRDVEITYYNVSWRGGYDVDNDPNYKKPRYEITWRGEYSRNYHDGHPIPRRSGFSYNGTHYASPAGQVEGGCIYVPSTGVDSGNAMIFIVEGSYNLHSKRLADIEAVGGWSALGQIPLGNTNIGNFGQFRSIFFSPDGSKAARTSWIWTTAQTEDDVQESDFTEYTMLLDGSQISQTTYNSYGTWQIDLTGTRGLGGDGTLAMSNTGDRPILGADYAPDGTLKTFAVSSWDLTGSWDNLGNSGGVALILMDQDITLDFDGFVFRGLDNELRSNQLVTTEELTSHFVEIHFADLRYHTLVYSDFIHTNAPVVSMSLADYTRNVRIRHSTVGNVVLFSYGFTGLVVPRMGAAFDLSWHIGHAGVSLFSTLNTNWPTEKFVLQKPWGDGSWPHSDEYYQGNLSSPGNRLFAVFGANLSLAKRTRPTDNDPATDFNTTHHWAAENPKGGLIIVLPTGEDSSPPQSAPDPDVLTFYMTGGQDLVALLADEGITVTIDRDDGHSFGHALK